MSKKKAAPKKSAAGSADRSQGKKAPQRANKNPPAAAASAWGAANIHVFRHEIQENPNNAPLVVEIPIAEGRGDAAPVPAFVGFTAEMSEECWPDQFAFRLVSLSGASARVMISRVDKGSAELAWGVKLVVHVLVVDRDAP